ncbi:MAG: DNA polymerase III subunit gamma/tau [Desulfobacterales bacterium]|jgi:DNA polymerase-3 subunit gamma/tau
MSYLVLARKYRPQTFDQVVEQTHITQTLSNAISSGRVAHAILFSGPRGTGKTTVARILAKALNCKEAPTPVPCNDCRSCVEITTGHAVDVFEIDGASNNSVDQIRDLRDNIKYMPAHSPYKIYIIDEVHMLSMAAFNALLKTLEEPPPHVMFMFATTEPHKIPITILSRCQRHDFRRISLNSIEKQMASICQQESYAIAEESLGLIAQEASGSMRDALSLLDQVLSCSQGAIDHQQVTDILGVVDRKIIFSLSKSILDSDIPSVLDTLDDIYDRGYDIKKFYADILEHFRNLLVTSMNKKVDKLVDLPAGEIEQLRAQAQLFSPTSLTHVFDLLFKAEASIRLSAQPKLALEIALIRILQAKPTLPIDVLIDKLDALRQEMVPSSAKTEILQQPAIPASDHPATQPEKPHEDIPASDDLPGDLEAAWQKIAEIMARKNPSLSASLSKCSLKNPQKGLLEIEVPDNGFTLTMIQREKNMAVLKAVCQEVFRAPKEIRLSAKSGHDETNSKKKTQDDQLKQKALSHPLVADAIEIFNGKLIDVKIH